MLYYNALSLILHYDVKNFVDCLYKTLMIREKVYEPYLRCLFQTSTTRI